MGCFPSVSTSKEYSLLVSSNPSKLKSSSEIKSIIIAANTIITIIPEQPILPAHPFFTGSYNPISFKDTEGKGIKASRIDLIPCCIKSEMEIITIPRTMLTAMLFFFIFTFFVLKSQNITNIYIFIL